MNNFAIKEALRDFYYFLLPCTCHWCGMEFTPLRGEWPTISCLCEHCQRDLPRTYNHGDNNIAEQKVLGKFPFQKGAAFCFYSKGSYFSRLIREAKYRNHPWINFELGTLFARELAAENWQEGIDVIVPIPVHYRRRVARGYNQVEYFGKGLSQVWGIPMDCHCVGKRKYTQTQVGKTREERQSYLSDVFEVIDSKRLEGKHILLIDDVLTTGTTMQSCARAIEEVSSVRISFLSLGLTN